MCEGVKRDDWDVLTFNRNNYYDIWALMYPPFQHHCWGFFDKSKQVVNYMKNDVRNRLGSCKEWIECQSAFNGFAMYKTPLFKGIRYDGEYKNQHALIPEEARQGTLHALATLDVKLNELNNVDDYPSIKTSQFNLDYITYMSLLFTLIILSIMSSFLNTDLILLVKL